MKQDTEWAIHLMVYITATDRAEAESRADALGRVLTQARGYVTGFSWDEEDIVAIESGVDRTTDYITGDDRYPRIKDEEE